MNIKMKWLLLMERIEHGWVLFTWIKAWSNELYILFSPFTNRHRQSKPDQHDLTISLRPADDRLTAAQDPRSRRASRRFLALNYLEPFSPMHKEVRITSCRNFGRWILSAKSLSGFKARVLGWIYSTAQHGGGGPSQATGSPPSTNSDTLLALSLAPDVECI